MFIRRVLTKMRNHLKPSTTSKKWPETTYNNLQRAKKDLKQPTMSKAQPTMAWTYLQQAKKRCEVTNSKRIFRLLYNMGQKVLFSEMFSSQHLVAVIRVLLHREFFFWRGLMMNKDSASRSRNRTTFFYYQKGQGFWICIYV